MRKEPANGEKAPFPVCCINLHEQRSLDKQKQLFGGKTMKKLFMIISVLSIIGLAACSDDPSIDSHPKEQLNPQHEEQNAPPPDPTGDMSHEGEIADDKDSAAKMDKLSFSKFDLEVEYAVDKEYDFDYEEKDDDGDYKAELYDSIHDTRLYGMEAFNALYSLTEELHFDENTPKEEIIQHILERFNLDQDYSSFELEIKFKNGAKIDIEDK